MRKPVADYQRTENFATGEVTIRWRDNRGEFCRRLYVSRTENLIALALIKKMYDAGRYMLICSAGEVAPNLPGIWTGS